MKEDRRGEAHRVQAIEHAAVAFDHVPPVLDPTVAFDRRHDNAAGKAQQVDQQRDQERLPEVERGDPAQRSADQRRQ
ncbi:hypothetical protein D3C75_1206930 [compost metagenome]